MPSRMFCRARRAPTRRFPRHVSRVVAAGVLVAAACATPTAADAPDVTGEWDGAYVEAVAPARALDARLQLTQDGVNVRGTLILVNGRSADASGPLVGRRLSLAFTYTDACAGTARWNLALSADGTTFAGTAESFDCRGDTRADVTLERR